MVALWASSYVLPSTHGNPQQLEVYCMMSRLWPLGKLSQLGELLPEKWEQIHPELKVTVLKTIKMMLIRPLCDQFQVTVRTDCCLACGPLPLPTRTWTSPLKAAEHWLSLWTGVCPLLKLATSKIRKTFLSTNFPLQYWLSSSEQPDPTFGNNLGQYCN